jgi:hypothetical protein
MVANYCDPSSIGTLTCVKSLVSMFRASCCRIRTIRNSGLFFFCFGQDDLAESHCINSTGQRSLIKSLKVIILPLLRTMSESELFTILFYGNPLTPCVGCIQTAVTMAMVTENVRMSRR